MVLERLVLMEFQISYEQKLISNTLNYNQYPMRYQFMKPREI